MTFLLHKDEKMGSIKVIMIGDVVGESGLIALEQQLPLLIEKYNADFVLVNGENSADGFGLTEETFNRIIQAGADVVSSGNHIWQKKDFFPILESDNRMLRPANYPTGFPDGAPGKGFTLIKKKGINFLAINLQGRVEMYNIDCPFACLDSILDNKDFEDAIKLIDFHAEAPSEKEALGMYADGRISLFTGTHTHVQTADERILPNGTGYITDLGMTSAVESIIGMDIAVCMNRTRTQVPIRLECAAGIGSVQGICAEIDTKTQKTISIERINQIAE
jgi:metallophosphoesterase (TIGR00282 family)